MHQISLWASSELVGGRNWELGHCICCNVCDAELHFTSFGCLLILRSGNSWWNQGGNAFLVGHLRSIFFRLKKVKARKAARLVSILPCFPQGSLHKAALRGCVTVLNSQLIGNFTQVLKRQRLKQTKLSSSGFDFHVQCMSSVNKHRTEQQCWTQLFRRFRFTEHGIYVSRV